ncbi:hypothetical protein RD792_015681 [Penstemon davidsonii]|uniref:NAD-dependent epimerase/dehydratase domain-containing protein n=1 Tax=Penstemon davidsonii TaxID=160366 RepID=A0ABR0CI01_9LAMI|nr:hypothetical protein RD792_015681 [Penstemon davidsonii]
MENCKEKGRVCVTGGTGFLASWLIMKLLQHGYSVNTTIRSHSPDNKKDVSFLTNLAGASERLKIFTADLDEPDNFKDAIEGCNGVFHLAHPMEFQTKESEETVTTRAVSGTLGILQTCLDSKTVKRVVYTSSMCTLMSNDKGIRVLDEESWTDVDYTRSLSHFGTTYSISKTLTEKAALEFGEKYGLDVVTVIPSWINGPFISPYCSAFFRASLSMIYGDEQHMYLENTPFVHTDDVASAHIYLFEHPHAKGRYICSAVEITIEKLSEFLAASSSRDGETKSKIISLSSKKLLDIGFQYKYGLEEMFDDAIECCKQMGFL